MMTQTFPLIGYDDLRLHHRRAGILEYTDEAKYLVWRGLNLEACLPHVRQVIYRDGKSKRSALGFRNQAGGWELGRKQGDDEWRGRAGPADVSFIPAKEPGGSLLVFAQFPEFLTYLSCKPGANPKWQHYLVLNDDSLIDRGMELASEHAHAIEAVQLWTPAWEQDLPLLDALGEAFPQATVGTMEHEYDGHPSLVAWRAAQLKPQQQPGNQPGQAPAYRPHN